MSTDHGITGTLPGGVQVIPAFLRVRPGDYVIVRPHNGWLNRKWKWWMGQVVFYEGGARDPRVNTMFQVSNIDDENVCWVNGELVIHIVCTD